MRRNYRQIREFAIFYVNFVVVVVMVSRYVSNNIVLSCCLVLYFNVL